MELPTGAYVDRESAVHRLGAGVKLLAFALCVAAVICCVEWWMYVPVAAFVVLAGRLSVLDARELLMPLRRTGAFLAVILTMNFLFFAGDDPLVSIGPLAPSLQGLEQGARIALSVGIILVAGNILTSTTSPVALTGALERAFRPLSLLHVPTRTLSLIVSVALQFVPTLLEETATIRKAQVARGAKLESPHLLEKAAAVVPLVVPVFVSAFRRADELSTAMEARGYRP